MKPSSAKLYRLEVSRYERVASMLLALLILLGILVLVMLITWLTSRIFASTSAVPVTMEEIGDGRSPLGPRRRHRAAARPRRPTWSKRR